ncbi:hypothetical protein [Helicobacter fennelliae]|uniref:hypothetical protein n=1 Tax=Helicobacter fennelliae TaxID=215 RepID=UPI000DFEE07D|nr:hypothetical protein [Helicobacter fennelliae]STQ92085.1 Uncharacterised protein [Helicobacter fennelliae]
MKEYKPISDSGELSEEPREFGDFYPLSYYDLSAFEPDEHIKCGDELFNGEIHHNDIQQIFLVMKGAGNPYDNQSFEVQTAYPNEMLNFMRFLNNEIHKTAHRMPDISSALEQSFEELKNITIKINIQNREVCICCDNLLRLIDKGFIRDEESLLAQSKILNNDLQKQGEESQVRIRKNRR